MPFDHKSPPASPRSGATLRSVAALVEAGAVAPEAAGVLEEVSRSFAVGVTPAMLAAMRPGDPLDPVARQFVPAPEELATAAEELADPIGDDAHSPVEGIVHRYPDRVLLKPIHVCPVYCRFCFRREVVGPGSEALSPAALAVAIDYIRDNAGIWEVILSGGDPLMLSPRRLSEIVAALSAIPHVGVIRLHTRVPVAAPERVTDELVAALDTEKAVYVVLHCNHADEFGEAAAVACRRIVRAGIPMLSQSVLLRGVNDDAGTMAALLRTLVRHRIKPYYLHHADLARGTAHFRTTIAEGQALMRALRGDISGLCQPTYVLDIPGGHGKVPIGPGYLSPAADVTPGDPRSDDGRETWIVRDPAGQPHGYPPSPAAKK